MQSCCKNVESELEGQDCVNLSRGFLSVGGEEKEEKSQEGGSWEEKIGYL
jgi:hypothetical protein